MAIRVEFYGIARQRAGLSEMQLQTAAVSTPLGDLLNQLATQLPSLGVELLANGKLHPAFSANVDGARFVQDMKTSIRDGQTLLLLSADAGG